LVANIENAFAMHMVPTYFQTSRDCVFSRARTRSVESVSVFVPSCRSAGDDMITCSWCTVLAKEILQSILLKLCMVSPSQEFNPILHGLTPPHPSTKPTNTANDQIQVHAFHLCHRILMYRRRTALKDTSIVVRLVCDERSQSLRRLGRPRRTNECPIQ
jgi:hypothetical protein